MKIFVAGSLNMDLTIKAPYVPQRGETLTGEGFFTTPGGKGANQAVASAKLGGEVYMVGCVGEAFGEELISSLEQAGVHTDFVERCGGVSSGIAVIVVVDGDNRIVLDKGANALLSEELVDRALETARAGDYLIVQLETNLSVVAYALKHAKEIGMVTVLNPAPAVPLESGMLQNCDYFIPNQTEAEKYTGIYPDSEKTVKQCAGALAEQGVKCTVITLGEVGSAGIQNGELINVAACKVRAVDTTGAGDTYVGALVTRLSEGAELKEAMAFASRASALAVTRRGAQTAIPSRGEVDGFI